MDAKWTGERLETFIYNENTHEHLHRYAVAIDMAASKTVLDIACGEGYGSNLIAEVAEKVTGVDISNETIVRAKKKYNRKNLDFVVGSADNIPASNNVFDLVVSFETIEHHDKHDEMIKEIKRVLKPNGILILSSPDKYYYTDTRGGFKNRHHVKELYKHEFKNLINSYFKNSIYFNQKTTFASLIIPENEEGVFIEYKGDYKKIYETKEHKQFYILAIATDDELPKVKISAFTDEGFINNAMQSGREQMINTVSYKIGNFLLWPMKKLFKK